MKRLNLLSLTCLWLLIGAGCSGPESPPEEPRPIRAVQIQQRRAIGERNFPGLASATQEVNLSFRVAGPLVQLDVVVGDEVENQQLIARIDPRDFEIAVRTAQGQIDRAQAALNRSEADYQRALRIQNEDPGAITERAVEKALQQRDSDAATVRSYTAELENTKSRLDDTFLRAPYAGRIVAKYVDNFQVVDAKQPIVRLLDTSEIEFNFNIPETAIRFIPYIRQIHVTFDAFPGVRLEAKIKEVGTEASTTTRTYPITLLMSQPKEVKVFPGMSGEARVEVDLPQDLRLEGVEVPASSVVTDSDGNSYVWVIDEEEDTVSRRDVQIDRLANNGYIVTEGLEPDEWIVRAGAHYLHEGQTVKFDRGGKKE